MEMVAKTNNSQVFNSLGFSSDVWSFGGDNMPSIKSIQALKIQFGL